MRILWFLCTGKTKHEVTGDANHYGVIIDEDGNFEGWIWNENIGWIHLRSVCFVDFKLFAVFALEWLETGMGPTHMKMGRSISVIWEFLQVPGSIVVRRVGN